jgi:FixJ family two-component response regulator
VYVVDDDAITHDVLRLVFKTVGLEIAAFASPVEFIEKFDPARPACVVLDLRMPEMDGIETLAVLRRRSKTTPVIFLTGYGDLSAVVRAMKLGAVDFLEKPVNSGLLLECVQHWLQYDIKAHEALRRRQATLVRLAKLSNRQRQVLDCVLNGMTNKETARHLGVSPKAIELHRAHVMQKMGARNLVNLVVEVVGCLNSAHRLEDCPPCLQRIEWAGLLESVRPDLI